MVATTRLYSFLISAFLNVQSYGQNRYDASTRTVFPTVHAECDAMNKLPRRREKLLKKIDLLVIRSNIGGTIGNSKPCTMCIDRLMTLPKRGYILDTVYYSLANKLVKVKFCKLIEMERHIPKYLREIY